ncbi:cupin domain-containing protein [Candidatus Thiosymbion oneisti]|uniref:cupin domain-containing protein n=1 Tax=Candidatus Thiosymbion oneisti TaxID=589554 RepID=UPI000A68672D|nr:cupin domain-containing protein [Candidatus Thiosymbion oneisti]
MNKNQWITELQLEPHVEGGYFRRTYQADYMHEAIPYATAPRCLMTSIFYMLTDDSPSDYLHVNRADIIHYFHAGSPLTYMIVHPDGKLERIRLGNNPAAGEQLQLLVKGGCWKTALLERGEFGLISEAVSPGFEYADIALITKAEVQTRFPELWIKLRSCIKP